jgi:hypothetical protein
MRGNKLFSNMLVLALALPMLALIAGSDVTFACYISLERQ